MEQDSQLCQVLDNVLVLGVGFPYLTQMNNEGLFSSYLIHIFSTLIQKL